MAEARKLIDSKTALVAVTHASNVLGTINPVGELVQLAHKVGAPIIKEVGRTLMLTGDNAATAKAVAAIADAVVVGSRTVQEVENSGEANAVANVKKLMAELRAAIDS